MTLRKCYQELGGDLAQVEQRLPDPKRIQRLLALFPDDDSFAALCQAMQKGCRTEAFRAAHTLKGVCGNLGLDKLMASSSRLTERLRPETAGDAVPEDAFRLLEAVRQDYEQTVRTIRAYLASDSPSD